MSHLNCSLAVEEFEETAFEPPQFSLVQPRFSHELLLEDTDVSVVHVKGKITVSF